MFPVLKQHGIFGPKKRNSKAFSISWLFPLKIHGFCKPGKLNALSNSMAFHDRVNPARFQGISHPPHSQVSIGVKVEVRFISRSMGGAELPVDNLDSYIR